MCGSRQTGRELVFVLDTKKRELWLDVSPSRYRARNQDTEAPHEH